jgi:hypothetical protein
VAARNLLARFPDEHGGWDRLGMVHEARGEFRFLEPSPISIKLRNEVRLHFWRVMLSLVPATWVRCETAGPPTDLGKLGFGRLAPLERGRPCYHPATLRKDNGRAIREVCRTFVALCRELDLLSEASVAIDGSKFKAVNARDKNFTEAKMKRERIEESIARGSARRAYNWKAKYGGLEVSEARWAKRLESENGGRDARQLGAEGASGKKQC